MCFSATVSFTVGTLLLPVGAYTLRRASATDKRYYPLATFPLLFGLQQLIEGVLWLSLGGLLPEYEQTAAQGFLFFAFLLWPALVPYSALRLETNQDRRRLLIIVTASGAILGSALYLPLLFDGVQITPKVIHHSISYHAALFTDGLIPRELNCVTYALLVSTPLMLSSLRPVRIYGMLILFSVLISGLFFHYAFTSIWCLFAALLSFYIPRLLPPMPEETGETP